MRNPNRYAIRPVLHKSNWETRLRAKEEQEARREAQHLPDDPAHGGDGRTQWNQLRTTNHWIDPS